MVPFGRYKLKLLPQFKILKISLHLTALGQCRRLTPTDGRQGQRLIFLREIGKIFVIKLLFLDSFIIYELQMLPRFEILKIPLHLTVLWLQEDPKNADVRRRQIGRSFFVGAQIW